MSTRLPPVPASFFSMVLGLAGLGTGWRVAAPHWSLPPWIGEAVMLLASGVWLSLIVLYGLKWWRHREAARAEIAHPIQCCFVALIPVTTMLIGMAALPYCRAVALLLCTVGGLGALAFGVWRHGGLWRGGRSVSATTPVLYLPTVAANLVSAIAMSALGWPELGQLFFGAGVLAWLVLESIIISRLLTAEELPPTLRPTLGIQMAPPAVALLAYASITTGPPDIVARMLLGYALVQGLLALRLLPWVRQPFTPSYWAYTFGVTALATSVMRYADRGSDPIVTALGPVLFAVANLVVLSLTVRSGVALVQGRLLPVQAPTQATPKTNA